jgi:hypothetical protein
MNRRRALLRGVAICASLVGLVAATSGAASADSGRYGGNLEAASAAIPAQAGDVATDSSNQVQRPWGGSIRGSAVATSSATCDGCQATAVTMQVIYTRHVHAMTVDNVAAAWSSCTACSGSALSLQVVIARKAGLVRANNRSLALNVACVQCSTAAAAVQIVVIAPSMRELSQQALNDIAALRDELAAELATQLAPVAQAPAVQATPRGQALAKPSAVTPNAQQALTTATTELQSVITKDLGASSATHDLQLRTG